MSGALSTLEAENKVKQQSLKPITSLQPNPAQRGVQPQLSFHKLVGVLRTPKAALGAADLFPVFFQPPSHPHRGRHGPVVNHVQ